MHCPACNIPDTKVIDSRLISEENTIRRRRKCEACQKRFTTHEKMQIQIPAIVKSDGRRENYRREKIFKGIQKACQKRRVSSAKVDSIVQSIEKQIFEESLDKEISSEKLGKIVMEKLHHLDHVAYIRFASFYCDFDSIDSFVTSLHELKADIL